MSGKPIVIGLLALGIAIAAAAIAYQSHVRPRIAGDLADDVKRPRAFADLLRMNRLAGHARKWSHDPAARGGKAYLRVRDDEGALWHLVSASSPGGAGEPPRVSTFIFREDGRLARVIEDSILLILGPEPGRSERAGSALIAAAEGSGEAEVHTIHIAAKGIQEALRVRGAFAIEAPGVGAIPITRGASTPPLETLPRLQYDAETRTFRGDPGGAGKPWEVDRARSPAYVP
ncbi:MAG TPA: hypothetical protein VMT52_03405 [Planctomycetota bacterium]|nr:hypothetical protein [Planctomycetota bacterium]